MIALYVGRRGCGKTTTLIKDAYRFKMAGWRVVTNMNSIAFADEVLDVAEILALLEGTETDIVLVLDEIQTFIDSRRSMRGRNVQFTYYIQQIRKRNVTILAATQFARRVDVAFREHVDILVRPQYYPEYPVIEVRYQDLTLYEDGEYDPLGSGSGVVLFDPRGVFPLFDTHETIQP